MKKNVKVFTTAYPNTFSFLLTDKRGSHSITLFSNKTFTKFQLCSWNKRILVAICNRLCKLAKVDYHDVFSLYLRHPLYQKRLTDPPQKWSMTAPHILVIDDFREGETPTHFGFFLCDYLYKNKDVLNFRDREIAILDDWKENLEKTV